MPCAAGRRFDPSSLSGDMCMYQMCSAYACGDDSNCNGDAHQCIPTLARGPKSPWQSKITRKDMDSASSDACYSVYFHRGVTRYRPLHANLDKTSAKLGGYEFKDCEQCHEHHMFTTHSHVSAPPSLACTCDQPPSDEQLPGDTFQEQSIAKVDTTASFC